MATANPPLRTKRGLSYVLGDNNNHGNHILPISSTQYSSLSQLLYTAGRDGTIKVWKNESALPSTIPTTDSLDEDEYQDIDEKLLKLETSITSNPIPYNTDVKNCGTYSIVDNYKIHFDWINDLKLINNYTQLVSCSSDLSIKLVDLDQSSSPDHCINHDNKSIHKFPNYHTDYIKKLSYNKNHNQIISGGLDESIIIWDLLTLKPTRQLTNRVSTTTTLSSRSTSSASIYSLSNNNGNLISTGGSNNSINLFDKRAQNTFIRKLIGHQDNVRCLVMNDSYILSGSSDTSIKLWDLRNFKVYKNFDIHDYPVWSLANEGDDFSVFYSGDKGGNIVKTDLRYLLSNSQFQPQLFPEFETFTSSDHAVLDEKLGISTIVAQGESPILSLCYEEDTIFSSNYTSLNRYYAPDLRGISKYQYLRSCLDYSINREIQLNDEYGLGLIPNGTSDTPSNPNPSEDLSSDFYDIVSHLSVDTNTHDIQLTFSYTPHNLFGETEHTNDSDYDDDDEYYSMFLDVNGGSSREFVNMYKSGEEDEANKDQISNFLSGLRTQEYPQTIDSTPVEILLNAIHQNQITRIPYNTHPITEWRIVPKSIISKRLFNNKRQMLVLYLNGDITIWDILTCKEIKSFPYPNANDQPLLGEVMDKRLKEMDTIYQDYQSNDTLNNWCDVEIKAGKLLVSIKETSFMNVEIYYDELIKNYPYAALEHPDNAQIKRIAKVKSGKDERFYLGTILLSSLFQQYTRFEWDFDSKVREELRILAKDRKKLDGSDEVQNNSNNAPPVGIDSNSVTSNLKRLKYFGRKPSKSNLSNLSVSSNQNSLQTSPAVSTATSLNDLAIESNPVKDYVRFKEESLKQGETSDYDNCIMKLLQSSKNVYWERYHYPTFSHSKGKHTETLLRADQLDPLLEGGSVSGSDEDIMYSPIFHHSRFPSDLLITVFEYSPDLGNYRDVCSFQFEDILRINKDPNEELVKNLRLQLPRWIGLSILYNKWPEKESPKIAFQLLECDYPTLPADKKIGGKVQRKIKKLPALESSIKLTSHNMLRVSKILYYLSEKFESKTSEMKDKKLVPPDWLVVDCKGVELSNDMTLQTIKTKIWKNSSDIELRFRRKFDT